MKPGDTETDSERRVERAGRQRPGALQAVPGLTAERRQRRQRELDRIKRQWAADVDEFERRMVLAAFEGEAREHRAD